MTYVDQLQQRGFAIIPDVLTTATVEALVTAIANVPLAAAVKQRAGRAFGIRRLLDAVPAIRDLAESPALRNWVTPLLGVNARVVRGIFFDKTPVANWKVPWHQDVAIAVREKKDVAGFSAWSVKAGIVHVQPPAAILAGILTVRLHLDDANDANGALRVLPGSHQDGLLSNEAIEQWKARVTAVTCCVPRGGALLMCPLLLHASSVAMQPSHRRVLHLEYSAMNLPGGLVWYGS